ncbi:MAG: hypothetical protein A3E85_05625 [Gammaproteobacteria bacterium RIFCSPHIGHO2_12_FULL_45_12]|nr:MAG: hypothetical protein A3E85_05625 [Gammaproteobacteria bacterium RIFCSPHIGHO2_12_FULL_45_12]
MPLKSARAAHCAIAIDISGTLNQPALQQALTYVAIRHDVLHSAIEGEPNQHHFRPLLQFPDNLPLRIRLLNATNSGIHAPASQIVSTLTQLGAEDFLDTPFHLDTEPLWRALLVQYSPDHHQLALLSHRSLMDQASIEILLKDISILYNHTVSKSPLILPILENQSRLQTDMARPEKTSHAPFWKETLNHLRPNQMPTDLFAPHSPNKQDGCHTFTLDPLLIQQLEARFASKTLESILLAACFALLARYSGDTDICIYANSKNRTLTTRHFINAFASQLPLRLQLDPNTSFGSLLVKTLAALDDAKSHETPLPKLLAEQDTHAYTAFSFHKIRTSFHLSGASVSTPVTIKFLPKTTSALDIGFELLPDGRCQGTLNYPPKRYSPHFINRFIGHLQQLLSSVLNNASCPIAHISLLLPEEAALIAELNHTETPEIPVFLPDLLHQVSQQFPHMPAVVYHGEAQRDEMSYHFLNEASTRLAHYIAQHHSQHNQTIGICLTRSTQLLNGILGAMKAGRTIVPLETQPEQADIRQYKLTYTHIPVVLVDHETSKLFEAKADCQLLNLDDPEVRILLAQQNAGHASLLPIQPETPIYIMYTSGTTGIPKAVQQTHGAIANLIGALTDQKIAPHRKVLCTALPTFDAFFFDLIVMLVTQGTLHLPYESGRHSADWVSELIQQEQLNYMVCLPDTLKQLDPTLPIENVISMGQAAHETTLNAWKNARGNRVVENGLGHTETGICLSLHQHTPNESATLTGRPIRNMKIHIVNPDTLTLCPIGIPGEIFVSGPGVADGYLNNLELSQTRFLFMRFDSDSQSFTSCPNNHPDAVKMYASGDYGSYQLTPNGLDIQFIGRKDKQIKLRGVNIHLDAIESLLRKNPLIRDIAVIPNKNNTQLIAYLVSDRAETSLTDWRDNFKQQLTLALLPPVAHPKIIVFLKEIPLTQNGKINKRALPLPDDRAQDAFCQPPVSALQAALRKLVAETLDIPEAQIGTDEVLGNLGCDSIGSTLLYQSIQNAIETGALASLPMNQPSSIPLLASLQQMTIQKIEAQLTNSDQTVTPASRPLNASFFASESGSRKKKRPTFQGNNRENTANQHLG